MRKMMPGVLLCLGLMQFSVSADPPISLDNSVNGLNPRVYSFLVSVDRATRQSGIMGASAAQLLCKEILADQRIDTVETDLLVELTQNQARLIRITGGDASAGTVTFGTTSGAARKVLRDLLLPQETVDSLLTKGADGWKQLALLSERSPADAVAVQAHLQKHIASIWGQSTMDNRYQPIRDFIKQADIDLKTLPKAEHQRSQAVLYEALLQSDAQAKGAIPDFFYNWLK